MQTPSKFHSSPRFMKGTYGVKFLLHGGAKVARGGHDGGKMLDLSADNSYATIEFAHKIGKPSCFKDLNICSMGLTIQFWLKAQNWAANFYSSFAPLAIIIIMSA